MDRTMKLAVSVFLDAVGLLSYLVPVIGPLSDIVFAPITWWWITHAYGLKKMAWVGFIEELLPFTDFIPTCTIAHWMTRGK